jgi:hypothetical protein
MAVGLGVVASSAARTMDHVDSRNAPPAAHALAPSRAGSAAAATAPLRFFPSSSFWNEPLPANAALESNSTAVVADFDEAIATEERTKSGPWINTTSYSVPIYTVPRKQRTVTVRLENHVPEPTLSAAWSAVPLPADAKPASGTDGILVVWQPSTDRLWEFWRLKHERTGWYAEWGGAMRHVASNPGVYGPEAWPGAEKWWGASASSLSLVGGLITLEDLERGQIDHALEMAISTTRAGVFSSPAQRSDGKTASEDALPEGSHLRLNPNLDLASLHLPRLTLLLAEAAQRYGIFITDTSKTSTFYAQDPVSTRGNPYIGAGGYFEGKRPSQLLESFPWSELELLKSELRQKK